MSEQAAIMVDQQAPSSAPASAAPAKPAKREKSKGAEVRIRELLSEVKALKSDRDKTADEHAAELDRLRGELLGATQEKSELLDWKDAHLRMISEKEQAERFESDAKQLFALRALIDVSHKTGAYARHPDFDTKLRRVEFSTRLLEMVLMFSPQVCGELAYLLACEPKAIARVESLPVVPAFYFLLKAAQPLEDAIKLQKLVGA